MNTKGPEHARKTSLEAEKLTRPEVVMGEFKESSFYAIVDHLFNSPGYYSSYFTGNLFSLALYQTMKWHFQSVFSPRTGPFLIENIMTGNTSPMGERISKATGIPRLEDAAVEYFKDEYKRLVA